MADESGMQEIRGIDIDKLAKGFADEQFVFKNIVANAQTSAREIRWYQKNAGDLTGKKTTGMTEELIANTDQLARPTVVEQAWTRKTSYVKKYFVESPTISMEDINDSDPDVLGTNVRDLVRAVAKQVDTKIFDVMTENQSPSDINTAAATNPWDGSSENPIKDILKGKENIRSNGYDPEGGVLLLNEYDYTSLIDYIISDKGASIPNFSSEKVRSGSVTEILGLDLMVSSNVPSDYAAITIPEESTTWKQFTPLKSAVINDPGVGQKIRVWEEGEALLTDPKAVHLITNTKS